MTKDPSTGGPGQRPDRADFDLVEDIKDAAAFDRALEDLMPKDGPSLPPGMDIDLDDFEAFNRELDAQMAQAKARGGRLGVIEDLGTDVVEPLPAPPATEALTPLRPEVAAESADEPAIADDVVTLGTTAPPAATVPAVSRPPTSTPPPAGAPGEPRARRSGVAAVLLAVAGLAAGGAGLWLSLERGAEVERLRAALGDRQVPAAPSPAPAPVPAPAAAAADPAQIRELEARLEDATRRLAALSEAAAPAAATRPSPPPTPQEVAAEPTAPDPDPEPKTPTATAEAPPVEAKNPDATTAGVEPPATAAPTPSPSPAPQAIPKPQGHGSWAVVLGSYVSEADAEQRRAQFERMKLPAEVRWFVVKDEVRYRVVVPGYTTQGAATAAAAELQRRKAGSAWVTRLEKQE